ncbi:MAG: TIGR02147 family protein [Chitinispirillaceae bacterium]|nr:TIGR02147 family protein [Chitinispirillaceae bacterium]
MPPNIFSYLDYRHYLGDLYRSLKEADPSFSFRSFARMAGSSSPNFLQLIRDRKLNIRPSGVRALSHSLRFSAKEKRFFEYMAAFDHARTHDEKDRCFRSILLSREYRQIKTLQRSQYELFSHWYVPVIRELVVDRRWGGDPALIGSRIIPAVSPAKVRKALAVLESLGLIRRNGSGAWEQTDRSVSTPSEVLSLAVTTYHKSVIAVARDALERFGPGERDFRSVTVGVSGEGYAEVKKRMGAFWKELLAFAGTRKKAGRVYQVNMQLFPLSRDREEK